MNLFGRVVKITPDTRESRTHAALDRVAHEKDEAVRLNRAWWEVRRAEQVLADKRRSNE